MRSLLKIVFLFLLISSVFSCQKTDEATVPPARPYNEVFIEDIAEIEEFLDTHYVVVDADYNTEFFEIPVGGTQTPISEMPELQSIDRNIHDITYKIYFLKLREGTGESPTRIDSSFVSYKGNLLSDVSVTFDQSVNPVWFPLEDVVRGWGEIIPQFKTGTHTANPDGTISFDNYGAGVMFLPSGLGYFNTATGNIPSYSPLIFNFKLHNLDFRDHDRDRILSKYEYGSDFNAEALDTDEDDIPDYIDVDDDGDGRLTKFEIRYTLVADPDTYYYYPFNGALVDDPLTPYDDTKGIPSCSGDFTTTTRLRKHLDKTCE
ncbi:FKBP-type peptidyl-prolyl cis-trans isomerase [Flavobacterium lacisediminis]|uniref:peptidylprolyl isomerase n=1 Tax=Flavobacterium lacisediminis TaxID=2989705 RepID=A0ABT3EG63_9FLAO|nr:FKBP-type peptidylprolyl isomerase [Flavobacterium lacisediminis]MCW1147568.1 FKBP-type peptidylprolyl isomerase [Flavobacterium lacisediminis]